MKILLALPGLHRYERGAEIAFTTLAEEFSRMGDDVTLIGSGPSRAAQPYRFLSAFSIRRERFEKFPAFPPLRSETAYEEASFLPGLALRYRPSDYDVTMTCAYPFTNWLLRRPALGVRRPAHVFVTQNGDWPAVARNSEYRLFGCDGLVCINPDFYERNRERWRSALIPNGMDPARFSPGESERSSFGLPASGLVVLMVSAMIASKRVDAGIRAVAKIPGAHLIVAGDGPIRASIEALAAELLPGRFSRITVTAARMPALYRSADVFLHLSQDESFGNVYVEAMACGLPVVAHDSARTRWIVGTDEYLADSNDSDAVAAQIGAAAQSGAGGRNVRVAKASAFAWSNIAAQYRAFFKTVIAARQADMALK